MRKHNNQTPLGFGHENHRLVTRRDFLGQGMVSGLGMVTAPSLLGLLGGSKAMAQAAPDCGISVGGAGKIPFLCIDLAGGANIAGSNVLVGGPGGQLDYLSPEGYSKLGLPADMTPDKPGQVNAEMGLLFHSDSAFLRGIQSKTSAATRGNMNGSVICARSNNDTGNNPHNPIFGINKAGANGDLLPIIGTENSDTGGKSTFPMSMENPTVTPTKVDRPSDVTGLVDLGGLVAGLEANEAAAVMEAVESISALKIDKMTEEKIVKDLISCSYSQSSDLVARYGNPSALNPMLDPLIVGQNNSIFSDNEIGQDKFRKTASVMKLIVNGFAGAGTIEFGGYDYHNSTRSRGEIRDFEAGQAMGAVFEYAARLNQQLMVYVFSDGSVSSNGELDNSDDGRGKGIWKSDSSSTSASLMLVYDPNGQPQLTSPGAHQLGYYRPSGDIETTAAPFSNNVDLLAYTAVLNYMALHNDVGGFEREFTSQGLGLGLGSGAALDASIAFQPIRA